MSTEVIEQNRVLAEFMGWQFVTVNYVGDPDETDWQKENAEWLDKVGLENVGNYFVKVSENKFVDWRDLKYHEDWNQIHAVWDRFKNLKISEVDEGFNDKYSRHLQAISTALHAFPITTVHIRLYNAIQWYQSVKK